MYQQMKTMAFRGMDSYIINVEVDLTPGLPGMEMIGYLGSEVKEAKERVRIGIKNSGYEITQKHITASLSPADVRKDGNTFDLAIALAMLGAMNESESTQLDVNRTVVIGEVGLDGKVHSVRGVLPMLLEAVSQKIENCIIPTENFKEAENVKELNIYPVEYLHEAVQIVFGDEIARDIKTGSCELVDQNQESEKMVGLLSEECDKKASVLYVNDECEERNINTDEKIRADVIEVKKQEKYTKNDFSQVYGQESARRAAEIAAAGFHNLLLFGPPGSGKSMIASRIPGIMPEMTREECLEVTKIYSVAGMLEQDVGLITERPFQAPHHTTTQQALVGGGRIPKPGMVTLAHKGILFLDEMPEFGRLKLDLLRQPLEDKCVKISRNLYTCTYQSEFMLVGAMNPCPCGYYPDRTRCNCKPYEIASYLKRISGPLLDRIDIAAEVRRMDWKLLQNQRKQGSSMEIRERIKAVRTIQMDRQNKLNANLTNEEIEKVCALSRDAQKLMRYSFDKFQMSVRSYQRIKRLARTIADLKKDDVIQEQYLAEAIGWNQGFDRIMQAGNGRD